jgi:hypothetical protein
MASQVFLHVGTFKSATTYIQAMCNERAGDLAVQGVLWLGSFANFAAVKDFDAAAEDHHEPTAWNELVERTKAHDGQVLVSNELLSLRTRRRTRALVRELDNQSVRIIMTARDPGRVIASQWQERARHVPTDSWAGFMDRLMSDGAHADPSLRWFWRRQDLVALVEKFADVVGIDNVTVVTVPRSLAEPGVLGSRFFSVLGIDSPAPPTSAVQNASMGAHSIEFMRRVHERLTDDQRQQLRIPIKHVLGRSLLTGRRDDEPPIGMTDAQHAWVTEYADDTIRRLRESGVAVVGDLDDLRTGPVDDYRGADPAATSAAQLVDAALDTVVGLIEVIDRQAREIEGDRYGEAIRRLAVAEEGDG